VPPIAENQLENVLEDSELEEDGSLDIVLPIAENQLENVLEDSE